MILVTGGFGFIGSNLIKKLNEEGIEDIIVCDNLKNNPEKYKNLIDCSFSDFIPKEDIFKINPKHFSIVFHLGACANTLEFDSDFMIRNNFCFSKDLLNMFINVCPFIYASSAAVYGASKTFVEHNNYRPLNVYGYSKLLFDRYVDSISCYSQITGLRFFNVYGPNEEHKGKMASVIHQLKTGKLAEIFEDGNQRRDFIHVYDIVSILLHFAYIKNVSGVFNVGTGTSVSFNEIKDCLAMNIGYKKIPERIREIYQDNTIADLSNLINIGGYTKDFIPVSSGIKV